MFISIYIINFLYISNLEQRTLQLYITRSEKKKSTLVNVPGNATVVCRMALSPGTLGNDISANIKRSPRKASSGPVHSDMVCLCKW